MARDRLGVLLLFAAGVSGLLIVFLIPNPVQVLAPQTPRLTPEDWPGSRIGQKMFFTDNWRTRPSDPWSPFLWEEKRGFYNNLNWPGEATYAYIDQTIVWFADPEENTAEWERLDPDTFNGWPISERGLDPDKPASILACNPGTPPQCWYLAYWEHWFTGVFFWRGSDEAHLLQDIRQLTARLDQLLIAAPEEPCLWFLCTSGGAGR